MKKFNRLQKNVEKLQIVLDILPTSKEQAKNKNINQKNKNAIVITNELGKVQQVLQSINDNYNKMVYNLKNNINCYTFHWATGIILIHDNMPIPIKQNTYVLY